MTIEFKALHDPDEKAPWDIFDEELRGILLPRRQIAGLDVDFLPPALYQVGAVADALMQAIDKQVETFRELPGGAGRARMNRELGNMASLRHPISQRDDLPRILSSLRSSWIEQLRTVEGPTLLVVLTHRLFSPDPRQVVGELRRIIPEFMAVLPQRRMLGGLVIDDEPMLPPPPLPVVHCDDSFRLAIGTSDGHQRTVLLMPNPDARVPLLPMELDIVVGQDMQW